MKKHFNGLTPAEAERLALIIEEAGEVIQAATKILRHGYGSRFPKDGPDNRHRLEMEIGDLIAVIGLAEANKDVNHELIASCCHCKADEVFKWLHHNVALKPKK